MKPVGKVRGLPVLVGLLVVSGVLGGCADRQRAYAADSEPSIAPGVVDFGRLPVFSGAEQDVQVLNAGRAELEVLETWVEGPGGTFLARFEHPGPLRLMPGSSTVLKVRFTPQEGGALTGRLLVRTDSGVKQVARVVLQGEGVDSAARLSTDFLDFGRIEAQARKTLPLTLENPSDLPTEVRVRAVGRDASEFLLPGPFTLGPYEKREVPVEWAPEKVGRKKVALSVTPCTSCPDRVVRVAAEALERAVVAEPPLVIFGQTPMDREALRTVVLRNVSTEPAVLTGQALTRDSDASFTVAPVTYPQTLAPGATLEVGLRYSPGHMGAAEGQVDFGVQSVRHPTVPVQLQGYGGAPELCVSPVDHDFGLQPAGSKTGLSITVKNCGTRNASPLTITEVAFAPPAGGGAQPFTLDPVQTPVTLAAGEELHLRVFYEPAAEGTHRATLHIRSSGVALNDVPVSLRGRARAIEPCNVAITPAVLDFGTIPPGWGAVLGLKVQNLGTDVCPVKNLRLVDDGGGVFSMPGGEMDGLLMSNPGEYFTFMVAFRAPPSGGTFAGLFRLEVADPANPVREVPLFANSQQSCLVATPNYLDFGVAWATCPADTREVNFLNACQAPVSVLGAAIGPGTTDGEFVLTRGLTAPMELQPGQAFTLAVDYLARTPGMNLSPLYVDAPSLAEPLMVPLVGESSTRTSRTDRFIQTDGSKVDVLFVVDNTASMVEEQPRFRAALPAFADAARARGVDLRVAVTTTGIEPVSDACPGGARGGEAGRFFPADGTRPRLLDSGMPDLGTLLQQNAEVGQCALVEQGFEAVRRALSPPLVNNADDPRTSLRNDGNAGFLREAAALAVVFVGDEDDHSPDEVGTYVQFLRTLKGVGQPQRVGVWAIAPGQSGCGNSGGAGVRYAEAARMTGGDVLSVCASDYRPFLQQVAERAFSPQDRFTLSEEPEPGTIVVRVDGAEVPEAQWFYSGKENAVVFSQEPAPGAHIEVQYRRTCSR